MATSATVFLWINSSLTYSQKLRIEREIWG